MGNFYSLPPPRKTDYARIESALQLLTNNKNHADPGNPIRLLRACTTIIQWVLDDSDTLTWQQKDNALQTIIVFMDSTQKCASAGVLPVIMQWEAETTAELKRVVEEIEYIKRLLLAEDLMDFDTMLSTFKTITNPLCPSEVHVHAKFWNIIAFLGEFKETLSRLHGHQDENFQLTDDSPFTVGAKFVLFYKDYDYSYGRNDNLYGVRMIVTARKHDFTREELDPICEDELFDFYSINCHMWHEEYSEFSLKVMAMEKFVEMAYFWSRDHKDNFCEKDYYSVERLKELLIFITAYLLHFKMCYHVKEFDEQGELKEKITENIKSFSFILHSLPLIKFLDPEIWIYEHFSSVKYAADLLLKGKNNLSKLVEVKKLRTVCFQFQYMIVIQQFTTSRDYSTYDEWPMTETHGIAKIEVCADVMTTEKSNRVWKSKFEKIQSKDVILKKYNDDKCPICLEDFEDLLSNKTDSDDLVVLPSCNHLFCLRCLEKVIATSGSM